MDSLPPRQTTVDDVAITAAPVPPRTYRGNKSSDFWCRVIAKFLQLGDESARIESLDRKAKSVYGALATEIKRSGEKRCYPTMRGGSVYLVRVPTNSERR